MSYYLTLFYPPSRTGKRIGRYFTASQISAAVVGLVSAGFQKMDGVGGLVGFQWMFLIYGIVGFIVGVSLLWWLPDRPLPPGEVHERTGYKRFLPKSKPALTGEDARIHYEDLTRVYNRRMWNMKDIWHIIIDWRIYPLVIMYFGVVGVGNGTQAYATVIIRGINPKLTGIQLSLLSAPIWLASILCLTIIRMLTSSDGRSCNSTHHSLVGSLPPLPCVVLQRRRHDPDHRAFDGHLCIELVTLWRSFTRRLRSWSNSPHLHGLGERDLPATTR